MHTSLKVAVIMGGPSGEHGISLKSGHGVLEALRRRQWTAEPLVIPATVTMQEARELATRALQVMGADAAFIALHGRFGEDGTIQQLCEELHLAYTGSDAAASRLGMNKVASRTRFEAAGLSVPRWRGVETAGDHPTLPDGLSCPVVVKPISEGSSLGVSIVKQSTQLGQAIAEAGQYGSQVLIEEFVVGRELTVGILDDDSLPIIEIRPHDAFFDFTAKYTPGLTDYLVPAPLNPHVARVVQTAALSAHRALGCRHMSRVDLILTEARIPVLLEINTIPGFTPTSLLPKAAACVGISYEELCERLVKMAYGQTPRAIAAAAEHSATIS